jgi:hypothetical protein
VKVATSKPPEITADTIRKALNTRPAADSGCVSP